jgi:hypothetical protein
MRVVVGQDQRGALAQLGFHIIGQHGGGILAAIPSGLGRRMVPPAAAQTAIVFRIGYEILFHRKLLFVDAVSKCCSSVKIKAGDHFNRRHTGSIPRIEM